MEGLRQCVLSLTAASLVGGLLMTLAPKDAAWSRILRPLCGVFLAVTLLSPVVTLRFSGLWDSLSEFRFEGADVAEAGVAAAKETMSAIIKDRTEAYILDKAASMGLSLRVEVILSEEEIPKPITVKLWGTVPPYTKTRLRNWMEDTLGIGEEDQLWQ